MGIKLLPGPLIAAHAEVLLITFGIVIGKVGRIIRMKKSVWLAVIIWARENVLAKILVALILIVLVVKRVRIIRIAI